MNIKKAIIPAAGLGTRMMPATKSIPKPMLPIVDKPTIDYIVEEAFLAGIEEIALIVGKNKEIIKDYYANDPRISFIEQSILAGLGHAILEAKAFVGNETFAVLLGDDLIVSPQPCIGQLMNVYQQYQQPIIGVKNVNEEDIHKYGIVLYQEEKQKGTYQIKGVIEKPIHKVDSTLAIMGRYILTPDIFNELKELKPGVGGEIQLTDAFIPLLEKREMMAFCFEGNRYDIGDKIGFLHATFDIALEHETLKKGMNTYLMGKLEDLKKQKSK